MTNDEVAVDGVLILDALYRIAKLGIAPDGFDWNRDSLERLPNICAAVQRDAGISDEDLQVAQAYSGDDWYKMFVHALYGSAKAREIARR